METPAAQTSIKIVEVTQVSPIPLLPADNHLPPQIQNSLPLTIFDYMWKKGLAIVVKTISDAVTNLVKYEYYERAEEVHSLFSKLEPSPLGFIGVAGSPKLEVYSVDFGWGRPRKVDVVSIDKGNNFSLAESRDQSGGIEIGFVMKTQEELQAFASFFIL